MIKRSLYVDENTELLGSHRMRAQFKDYLLVTLDSIHYQKPLPVSSDKVFRGVYGGAGG